MAASADELAAATEHLKTYWENSSLGAAILELPCQNLMEMGYFSSCGPDAAELAELTEGYRRYLEEAPHWRDAAQSMPCEQLVKGGHLDSCGPDEAGLQAAREAMLADLLEENFAPDAGCKRLLAEGIVKSCDMALVNDTFRDAPSCFQYRAAHRAMVDSCGQSDAGMVVYQYWLDGFMHSTHESWMGYVSLPKRFQGRDRELMHGIIDNCISNIGEAYIRIVRDYGQPTN